MKKMQYCWNVLSTSSPSRTLKGMRKPTRYNDKGVPIDPPCSRRRPQPLLPLFMGVSSYNQLQLPPDTFYPPA